LAESPTRVPIASGALHHVRLDDRDNFTPSMSHILAYISTTTLNPFCYLQPALTECCKEFPHWT
jgi:hypothetical protein